MLGPSLRIRKKFEYPPPLGVVHLSRVCVLGGGGYSDMQNILGGSNLEFQYYFFFWGGGSKNEYIFGGMLICGYF